MCREERAERRGGATGTVELLRLAAPRPCPRIGALRPRHQATRTTPCESLAALGQPVATPLGLDDQRFIVG